MPQKRSAKRVIIVEDQKATAWALAESLTEDGYETLTAGSSEEALGLEIERCDVLITDLRLPGMNGIELMSRIKKTRKALPSILITAYSSPDVLASAKKAGAIRCFSKPFNVEDIKECLKKALEVPRGASAGRSPAERGLANKRPSRQAGQTHRRQPRNNSRTHGRVEGA
jgi:two-component system response regulator (stage 0 sporulation protein F)